jgi:hypothetical protein
MARSVDERVQTARKYKKANASAFFTAAHNGQVTGRTINELTPTSIDRGKFDPAPGATFSFAGVLCRTRSPIGRNTPSPSIPAYINAAVVRDRSSRVFRYTVSKPERLSTLAGRQS